MTHIASHYAPVAENLRLSQGRGLDKVDEGVFVAGLVRACQDVHGFTQKGGDYRLMCQEWFTQFTLAMLHNGYRKLGNGYFAAAFATPRGDVIKVGFKKEDSGAAYAAFCRAAIGNEGAQFLPYVSNLARHARCYTVHMPKYEKYSDVLSNHFHFDDQQDALNILRIQTQYAIASSIIDQGNDVDLQAMLLERIGGRLYGANSNAMMLMRAIQGTRLMDEDHEFMVGLEQFAEMCRGIRDHFDGIACFDIHDENIMVEYDSLTGEMNLIITDPISWSRDEDNCPIKDPDDLSRGVGVTAAEEAFESGEWVPYTE